jgi:hypothetical protein
MQKQIDELSSFLEELKDRYLAEHLASTDELSIDSYDLDVRAYCVFAHAGIEQFFEELAEHALEDLISQWERGAPMSRKTVVSLISIATSQGVTRMHIEDDENVDQMRPLHYASNLLRANKKTLLQNIHKNHGASLKYLRNLFAPLGIDVNPDANADSALKRLANSRGAFAHRRTTSKKPGHHVYKPINPTDALAAARDCLKFCKELTQSLPTSKDEKFYAANGLVRSTELLRLHYCMRAISKSKTEKIQIS